MYANSCCLRWLVVATLSTIANILLSIPIGLLLRQFNAFKKNNHFIYFFFFILRFYSLENVSFIFDKNYLKFHNATCI